MGFFIKRAKKRAKNVKNVKKGKMFENLGKHVQNLKIFWRRTDNHMQLNARMSPDKL